MKKADFDCSQGYTLEGYMESNARLCGEVLLEQFQDAQNSGEFPLPGKELDSACNRLIRQHFSLRRTVGKWVRYAAAAAAIAAVAMCAPIFLRTAEPQKPEPIETTLPPSDFIMIPVDGADYYVPVRFTGFTLSQDEDYYYCNFSKLAPKKAYNRDAALQILRQQLAASNLSRQESFARGFPCSGELIDSITFGNYNLYISLSVRSAREPVKISKATYALKHVQLGQIDCLLLESSGGSMHLLWLDPEEALVYQLCANIPNRTSFLTLGQQLAADP